MKATEFVKNYGLSEAISKVEDCEFLRAESFNWLGHEVNCDELKRLVESHEIVERAGGLRECRLMSYRMNVGDRLAQAIADVEACQ